MNDQYELPGNCIILSFYTTDNRDISIYDVTVGPICKHELIPILYLPDLRTNAFRHYLACKFINLIKQ